MSNENIPGVRELTEAELALVAGNGLWGSVAAGAGGGAIACGTVGAFFGPGVIIGTVAGALAGGLGGAIGYGLAKLTD